MVDPSELRHADQVNVVVQNEVFCVSASLLEEKCEFLHQRINALLNDTASKVKTKTKASSLSNALSGLQFHDQQRNRLEIRLVDHKRNSDRLQQLPLHTIQPPAAETLDSRSSHLLSSPLRDKENVTCQIKTSNGKKPAAGHSVVWIEFFGASTKAVDALFQFLGTSRVTVANEQEIVDCGDELLRLCKFLLLEDSDLAHETLKLMIENRLKWSNSVDLLLKIVSVQQRSAHRPELLECYFSKLTELLIQSSASQSLSAVLLRDMHFAQLPAVEDVFVFCRLICVFLKYVHQVDVWNKFRRALELWISSRLPLAENASGTFVSSSASDDTIIPCLLQLHHRFVDWKPCIHVDNKMFSGLNCFLVAQPVCRFGPFELQIRLETDVTKFIQWRVIKPSSSSTKRNMESVGSDDDLFATRFVLRGRLSVWVWPLAQRFLLSVRYENHRQTYGKWRVLLRLGSGASTSSTCTGGGSTTSGSGLSGSCKEPPIRQAVIDFNQLDSLSVTLAGTLFVWGHPLCNLYHFLLNSTLLASTTTNCASASGPTNPQSTSMDAVIKHTPFETLWLVLQSDSLRIDKNRTTSETKVLDLILAVLERWGVDSTGSSPDLELRHQKQVQRRQMRRLLHCVRWQFTDCVSADTNSVNPTQLALLQQRLDQVVARHKGFDRLALTPLVSASLSSQRHQIPRRAPFWN